MVEAHTVLSDGERRAKYDRGEDVDGSMASDPMGHPFGGKQMMKTPAFSKGISYRGF